MIHWTQQAIRRNEARQFNKIRTGAFRMELATKGSLVTVTRVLWGHSGSPTHSAGAKQGVDMEGKRREQKQVQGLGRRITHLSGTDD